MLPKFGLKWINWCTFATTALCIPLLALWRQKRYRSDVDAKDCYIPAPHNRELNAEVNYGGVSSTGTNGHPSFPSIQENPYSTDGLAPNA